MSSYEQLFGAHKTLPQALADIGTILVKQNLFQGTLSTEYGATAAMLFDDRVKLDVFEGATGGTGAGDTAIETNFVSEFPGMQVN